ncbi:hypothetical protein EJ06DRAFT_529909 [Trichodelitschia bisporula]|uniref:DUF4336 domain-containing protein n=1 Tax=Trichodelitschia bisporula TaxID=703511 RepID=A0A6G1HXQ6_9PEZI|nr:hypothetical protein EJ06DRAFT_529909 [Trichodelitschia bisporula]
MSSKLVPSNPSEVMVIRKVTENITTLSVPFWRFSRIKVGGRGTLVRLSNGTVAVFSPVALTPEVQETVASMGELKYIAALDLEHHIFVGAWHAQYPNAKVIGPEGLPEKRTKQKNEDVPFATVFNAKDKATTSIDADFDADFDYEYVDGHASKELVFHYKPDGALIEADLMFNLPATEQFSKTGESANTGFLTKLFCSINRTDGAALGQQRFIWYLTGSANRPSFQESIRRINGWNFDKIIPCHGDVIETDAKGIFEKVFKWHLEGKKAKTT